MPSMKASTRAAPDAVQVVAHAHVEDRLAEAVAGRHGPRAQHLDQHRALDVLLERLLELELLRPLDVEADGVHVDARARDVQLVEHLDRLELHDPAAAEPRQHEVLRHLGLRPRRRPQRARGVAAVEGHREIEILETTDELRGGEMEDRPAVLQLVEHVLDERRERKGSQVRQVRSLRADGRWLPAEGRVGRDRRWRQHSSRLKLQSSVALDRHPPGRGSPSAPRPVERCCPAEGAFRVGRWRSRPDRLERPREESHRRRVRRRRCVARR